MKGNASVMEFMGKDHDRLDRIFVDFRKLRSTSLEKAIPLFHDFKIGLQRHIVWEEEILFPIFERKTGMRDSGPTAVMRTEHRKIRDFLEGIHGRIASGDSKTGSLENGLLEVLSRHNHKEENVLYPWIDSGTTESERKEVFRKMKNMAPEKYNKCCE